MSEAVSSFRQKEIWYKTWWEENEHVAPKCTMKRENSPSVKAVLIFDQQPSPRQQSLPLAIPYTRRGLTQ